jgi:hypothetical protein
MTDEVRALLLAMVRPGFALPLALLWWAYATVIIWLAIFGVVKL